MWKLSKDATEAMVVVPVWLARRELSVMTWSSWRSVFASYVSSGASPATLLRLRMLRQQLADIPKLTPALTTADGRGSNTRSSPASAEAVLRSFFRRRVAGSGAPGCALGAATPVELGIVPRAKADDVYCMRFYFLQTTAGQLGL
jgi:hypothetical protein